MDIFLRNIPPKTRRHDIIAFIEPALKKNFFMKRGRISKIQILIFRDTALNKLEYHGLVTVEPDAAAERVINRLNRKKFLGKPIAVKEYIQRDWHNDRRLNRNNKPFGFSDKRKTDRRRGSKLEVIEDVSAIFSGREGFHRKQGN